MTDQDLQFLKGEVTAIELLLDNSEEIATKMKIQRIRSMLFELIDENKHCLGRVSNSTDSISFQEEPGDRPLNSLIWPDIYNSSKSFNWPSIYRYLKTYQNRMK